MRARQLSLLLSAVFTLAAAAATAGPWMPAPGEHYNEFRAGRATADQFLDAAGNTQDLPGGAQTEGRTLTSYNELGWKERWSVVFAVPLRSITHRDGAPGYADETETGLGDLWLAVRRNLANGGQALSLQADWLAPLGYDRQAVPTLGDGQQKMGLRASYGASLPGGFLQASGGGLYLFEDEETLSFAGVSAAFWLGPHLLIAGEYAGVFSELTTRHVAGPELRLRVDDNVDVFGGSRHTLSGESVLSVNEFYFGVAFKKTQLNRFQGFLGGTSRP